MGLKSSGGSEGLTCLRDERGVEVPGEEAECGEEGVRMSVEVRVEAAGVRRGDAEGCGCGCVVCVVCAGE